MTSEHLRLGHDPGPDYPHRPVLTSEDRSEAEAIRITARDRILRLRGSNSNGRSPLPSDDLSRYSEFVQLSPEEDARVDGIMGGETRGESQPRVFIRTIVEFVRRLK